MRRLKKVVEKRLGPGPGWAGAMAARIETLAAVILALVAAGSVTACSGGGHGPSPTTASVSGDVLLPGGVDQFNGPTATAEFYNVTTGAFDCSHLGGVNSTTGACNNTMTQARFYASVAPLPNSQVLVAGGNGTGVQCFNSAEIFNPAAGSFSSSANAMYDAHCFVHTTTVLQDGRVLITGGEDATGNLVNTADMYNPTTGQFDCSGLGGVSATTQFCQNTMNDTLFLHTATLLQNGQVLIVGGNDGVPVANAQIFDPASGTFGCAALGGANASGFCNNTMTDSRQNHSATLLVSGPVAGDVLIAGGLDASGVVLQTAELFQPSSGTFVCSDGSTPGATGCPAAMTHARYLHTAVLLDPTYVSGSLGGDVLITGGEDSTGTVLSTAEVYNPATGKFTAVGSMTTARALHAAALITSGPLTGYVLIAGGVDNAGNSLSSAELFNPATGQFAATGSMQLARSSAGVSALR